MLSLVSLLPLTASAQGYVVPESFWLTPRNGAVVVAEPAVSGAVRRLLVEPKARLVLHHARDEEAKVQAEELLGWLIALGIDPARVELAADGGSERSLRLEVAAP
jgi:hypothetical protein